MRFDFPDALENMIPLPNYESLLIFETGRIVKVNLLKSIVVKEGLIDKDIYQIALYDEETVVYISLQTQCIRFFNFVKFEA